MKVYWEWKNSRPLTGIRTLITPPVVQRRTTGPSRLRIKACKDKVEVKVKLPLWSSIIPSWSYVGKCMWSSTHSSPTHRWKIKLLPVEWTPEPVSTQWRRENSLPWAQESYNTNSSYVWPAQYIWHSRYCSLSLHLLSRQHWRVFGRQILRVLSVLHIDMSNTIGE
jgi:hypothetical protein